MDDLGVYIHIFGSIHPDVNVPPHRLHLAAQFQCNGALQLLIDAKAALKKRDVNGCNALHRAGLGDNAEGVR